MKEENLLAELQRSQYLYRELLPIRQRMTSMICGVFDESFLQKRHHSLVVNFYKKVSEDCLDNQGRVDERALNSSLWPLSSFPATDVLGKIFDTYDSDRIGYLTPHTLREMLEVTFRGSARLLINIAADPASFALPFQPLKSDDIMEVRSRIATILDTTKIDSIIHRAAQGSLRRQRNLDEKFYSPCYSEYALESERSFSSSSSTSLCSTDAYSGATVNTFTLEDITACFPLTRRLALVAQGGWTI